MVVETIDFLTYIQKIVWKNVEQNKYRSNYLFNITYNSKTNAKNDQEILPMIVYIIVKNICDVTDVNTNIRVCYRYLNSELINITCLWFPNPCINSWYNKNTLENNWFVCHRIYLWPDALKYHPNVFGGDSPFID